MMPERETVVGVAHQAGTTSAGHPQLDGQAVNDNYSSLSATIKNH
jgi:hypothetical protein